MFMVALKNCDNTDKCIHFENGDKLKPAVLTKVLIEVFSKFIESLLYVYLLIYHTILEKASQIKCKVKLELPPYSCMSLQTSAVSVHPAVPDIM